MKTSSVPCVLSLVFGISTVPLHVIAFYMAYAATSYNYYQSGSVKATVYSVIDWMLYGLIAALIIAGIVLGIIGLKQRRPKKEKAIAGIIICSFMLIAPVFQYYDLIHF